MRLLRLHCVAFGCFTDVTLDFGEPSRAFHVIYGANEAGKSTALRALVGLLFGIDARTTDDFVHKMSELRIAAELERADGARLAIVRRKGNKNTLRDAADNPIPEARLAEFLGGASKEIFGSLYRLDHPALRDGGNELLAGKGDVAESLFQAGTGVRGLHEVLAALDAEAESWFKPRSGTPRVNAAMRDYEEARKRSRESAASPKDWVVRDEEMKAHQTRLRELRDQLQERRSTRERLNRFKLALPHVTKFNEYSAELAYMRSAPLLGESAPGDREEAIRRRQQSLRQKEECAAALEDLNSQLALVRVPRQLLEQAAAVSQVCEQLSSYRNAVRDLPQVRAVRQQLIAQATTILRGLRPDLSLDQAECLRLTELERSRIKKLANDHGALVERRRSANDLAEDARKQWEQTQDRLRSMPLSPDVGALQHSLERARKPGDLEAELQKRRRELAAEQDDADRALRHLPLWSGTWEQLESLPVPSLETVEESNDELRELTDTERRWEDRKEELDQRRAQVKQAIRTLQIGGAVPTEDDLAKARADREQSWRHIRRAWIDGQLDLFESLDADSLRELADRYQQRVLEADAVADRLRREAERVARLAELLAEQSAVETAAKELRARRLELARRRELWQEQWQRAWDPSGIAPLSPREMRRWLIQHKELFERLRSIRQLDRSVRQLGQVIEGHRDALARALASVTDVALGKGLAGLIEQVEAFIASARRTESERADLERELHRLAAVHQKAAQESAKAQAELQAWTAGWSEALAPLGFGPEVEVTGALVVLDQLEAMSHAIANADNHRIRVEQMERHITQLADAVGSLVRQLAPELGDLPPDQAAVRLQGMVTKAQHHEVRRENIEKQIEQVEKMLAAATTEIEQADEQLARLMAKAHCDTLEALEDAEENSALRRRLESKLQDEESTLMAHASGASLRSFLAEIAAVNADRLPAEIEQLEREIAELETQCFELERQIGGEQAELKRMDGGDEAAAAAADAQSALAAIRSGAERYFRVRLASEVLRRFLEQYREQNQDPVVRRASELLPQLTCGSFARLKTGLDEKDRPVFLPVRPAGAEIGVGGMSDGARDQLFLALRLASLERQLEAGEPLPFVIDDALVNFDDDRAAATLAQLAELAARTQVLFFTHHARLVELAERAVPASLLKVHQLERL